MLSPYKTDVSIPATARELTTLATVKSELGIATNEHDVELSRVITEQSAAAETFCGRVFAEETLIDHFRLECIWPIDRFDSLILSRRPLKSISSIVEDGITLAAANFELNLDLARVWRLDGSDGRVSWLPAKIIVTFVAGYELSTALPADVERAVILMVKQAWFAQKRDPLVKSEEVPGVLRQDFWIGNVGDNALPPEAASLLDPFRRRLP